MAILWGGPVKTEQRASKQVGFEFLFKLGRRAVAEGGVAPVEVKVGIKVPGDLQLGFFEESEDGAVRQQFGFAGAPTSFGLRVVVGIGWRAEAGQRAGRIDAGAAGVLATPVGVDNEPRCEQAPRQVTKASAPAHQELVHDVPDLIRGGGSRLAQQ